MLMDLSLRYPLVVQVIVWNGREYYRGSSPDFGWIVTEPVEPGNVSQEFMFYLGLRRKIAASLSVYGSEGKVPPAISSMPNLHEGTVLQEDMGSNDGSETISSNKAAKMLEVHADTIRGWFDLGILSGNLTSGGHRQIYLSSVIAHKKCMQKNSKDRVFEERSRKKNQRRKAKRRAKEEAAKLERFEKYFISNSATSTD